MYVVMLYSKGMHNSSRVIEACLFSADELIPITCLSSMHMADILGTTNAINTHRNPVTTPANTVADLSLPASGGVFMSATENCAYGTYHKTRPAEYETPIPGKAEADNIYESIHS